MRTVKWKSVKQHWRGKYEKNGIVAKVKRVIAKCTENYRWIITKSEYFIGKIYKLILNLVKIKISIEKAIVKITPGKCFI